MSLEYECCKDMSHAYLGEFASNFSDIRLELHFVIGVEHFHELCVWERERERERERARV